MPPTKLSSFHKISTPELQPEFSEEKIYKYPIASPTKTEKIRNSLMERISNEINDSITKFGQSQKSAVSKTSKRKLESEENQGKSI